MSYTRHSGGRLRAALFCFVAALGVGLAAAQPAGEPLLLRCVAWQNAGERYLAGTTDLLAAFAEQHPGLRVNLTHEDWSQAALRMRYWCGSHRQYAPDFTILPDAWLATYEGQLAPLDEVLKPRELKGFIPAMLDRCRVRGRLLGLPWIVRSRALYYRTDLLETAKLKPPQTWAELQKAAVALSRPPEVYGLGLAGRAGNGAVEAFFDLLIASGGSAVDKDSKLNLTGKPAQEALARWVALQQAGALQPEGLSWSEQELQTAFAQGRLALLIAGPRLYQQLRNSAPALKFGVVATPREREGGPHVSAEVLVMLKSTSHPQEGAQFLRYMASGEAQRAMSLMGGLPTIRAQYERVRRDPDVAPFVADLEQAQGLPTADTETATRIVERAVWLALSGRMRPAEALKQASDEEAQRIY